MANVASVARYRVRTEPAHTWGLYLNEIRFARISLRTVIILRDTGLLCRKLARSLCTARIVNRRAIADKLLSPVNLNYKPRITRRAARARRARRRASAGIF